MHVAMTWNDLLFAHWPVPSAQIRPLVPDCFSLDTFDGAAWIGVVPFRMTGIKAVGMPSFPGLSAFLELNVRTYVTAGGKPGVYFFSLDAANPVAVRVARRVFHLPYFDADMSLVDGDGSIQYESRRTHRGSKGAVFVGRYAPIGGVQVAAPRTLEHFLVERYALYTIDARGRAMRGDVRHAPWPLQIAEADLAVNTMARARGIGLPATKPLLHFARRLEVVALPLVPTADDA